MKNTQMNLAKATVRSMIRQSRIAIAETKGQTVSYNGQPIVTTGAVVDLTNSIVLGDARSQRNGAQISLLKFKMDLIITAVGVSSATRIIVFQDHQNNGATPVTTDVLDTATTVSGLNPLTVDAEKRYKILYDRYHPVNIAGQAIIAVEKEFRQGFSRKLTFLGNTFVPGANGKNAIFMLAIGTNATTVVDVNFRFVYMDN